MKHLLTILIALTLFTSCKEKTKEDYIKEAFKEYVNTDFDDPSEVLEITKIDVVDTLNANDAKSIIVSLTGIQELLTPKEIVTLADYAEKFDKDTTCIIVYVLNVRIKHKGNRYIVKYYVIDDGINLKVQDHELSKDETPELYKGFFEFVESIIDKRKY